MPSTSPDPVKNPFGLSLKKLFGFASKAVTRVLRVAKDFAVKSSAQFMKAPQKQIIQTDAARVVFLKPDQAGSLGSMEESFAAGLLGFVPISVSSGPVPSPGTALSQPSTNKQLRRRPSLGLKL